MEAKFDWLNSLINKNKNEFSGWPEIEWLNYYSACKFQTARDSLLIESGIETLFKDTKPFANQISDGCNICGNGKWSCLFVTNKCNASCFYCPTPQQNDEIPSTQGLDFEDPDFYADYINHFNFAGVSFSGGEPLLYFEKTLNYLKVIRRKCDKNLYIWMYTNGILAEKKMLNTLAREGLNEIRFDIGATGYSLDKVKLAKGIIPNVSIEIPSIPEKKDEIIDMLPDMIEAGVTNLNLHHLRLTPHNASKLIKKGYSFIIAERPLVLESELAALEIIKYVKEAGLKIGINYCSFHFKNRFQKAGFRRVITEKIFPESDITENGFIREFNGDSICYKSLKLFSDSSDLDEENTIEIKGKKYKYMLTNAFYEENLSSSDKFQIFDVIKNEPSIIPESRLLFNVWQCEYIEKGLREYY